MSPPNKTMGITNNGASAIAFISCSNIADSIYPIDYATTQSNPKLTYKSTNCSKLLSNPNGPYIIQTSINGFKRLIGSSATFFAMKYANTEYILLDYSLIKTGRSS